MWSTPSGAQHAAAASRSRRAERVEVLVATSRRRRPSRRTLRVPPVRKPTRRTEAGRGERVVPGVWRLRLPLPWPAVPHGNGVGARRRATGRARGLRVRRTPGRMRRTSSARSAGRAGGVERVGCCLHARARRPLRPAPPSRARAGCELRIHPRPSIHRRSEAIRSAARAERAARAGARDSSPASRCEQRRPAAPRVDRAGRGADGPRTSVHRPGTGCCSPATTTGPRRARTSTRLDARPRGRGPRGRSQRGASRVRMTAVAGTGAPSPTCAATWPPAARSWTSGWPRWAPRSGRVGEARTPRSAAETKACCRRQPGRRRRRGALPPESTARRAARGAYCGCAGALDSRTT